MWQALFSPNSSMECIHSLMKEQVSEVKNNRVMGQRDTNKYSVLKFFNDQKIWKLHKKTNLKKFL